jgi:3'-phosphoadenosine 5'-phosphosulfate (PAPS) 3'-phosphatase
LFDVREDERGLCVVADSAGAGGDPTKCSPAAGEQGEAALAAPVAVAGAAGPHASRLDGSALRYNEPDPDLPDLLICRPELAADVLEVLRAR